MSNTYKPDLDMLWYHYGGGMCQSDVTPDADDPLLLEGYVTEYGDVTDKARAIMAVEFPPAREDVEIGSHTVHVETMRSAKGTWLQVKVDKQPGKLYPAENLLVSAELRGVRPDHTVSFFGAWEYLLRDRLETYKVKFAGPVTTDNIMRFLVSEPHGDKLGDVILKTVTVVDESTRAWDVLRERWGLVEPEEEDPTLDARVAARQAHMTGYDIGWDAAMKFTRDKINEMQDSPSFEDGDCTIWTALAILADYIADFEPDPDDPDAPPVLEGFLRPVREITAEEENFRVELFYEDSQRTMSTTRRDPVEPEPIGSYVVMAFRIDEYHPDCDGSLMMAGSHVDRHGEETGWTVSHLGLRPDSDLVVSRPSFLWKLAETMQPKRHEAIKVAFDLTYGPQDEEEL